MFLVMFHIQTSPLAEPPPIALITSRPHPVLTSFKSSATVRISIELAADMASRMSHSLSQSIPSLPGDGIQLVIDRLDAVTPAIGLLPRSRSRSAARADALRHRSIFNPVSSPARRATRRLSTETAPLAVLIETTLPRLNTRSSVLTAALGEPDQHAGGRRRVGQLAVQEQSSLSISARCSSQPGRARLGSTGSTASVDSADATDQPGIRSAAFRRRPGHGSG